MPFLSQNRIFTPLYLTSLFVCFAGYLIPAVFFLYYVGIFGIIIAFLPKISALRVKLNAYDKWLLAFVVFCFMSVFWALNARVAIGIIWRVILMSVITVSIISSVKDKLANINDVFKVFLCASFVFLFYVLIYFDWSSIGEDRLSDTKSGLNGNGIAGVFVIAIYISCILMSGVKNFLVKSGLFFTICIMLFLILMTGSRSALFLLILPYSIYLFLKMKRKIYFVFYALCAGFILLYVLFKIPIVYNVLGYRIEEMVSILNGVEQGDTSRLLLVLYGVEWFQEHPVLGVGINNYRVLSTVTAPFVGMDFYAHNNFIELLVDVGIVGTILYYSIYVFLIRKSLRIKSDATYFIAAVLVSFVIYDNFLVSYYELSSQFVLASCYAVILNKSKTGIISNDKLKGYKTIQ